MAYRVLILVVLAVIISTSPSVRTATTTSQRVSCVRDIVTIVGGGGIVGIAATLWKLVNDHRSGGEKEHVYSDVPRIPSNHLFQPRAQELRELEEKFNTLEMTNPGDVVVTVYITGDPASGKTQLAGQYGREFTRKNKHKNKNLFAGTLIADSRSNFLDKYIQIAHDLGCITEETEKAIESHQLDELASLRMLSKHVRKELRKRPGWLLIIDGLSLDEKLVKELRPFWPQPNDGNWGKGYVLVTTQSPAPTGPSISTIDLRGGMSRKDAVELIIKESNCSNEEGAVELVKLLDRSPLSIACAGVYIRNARSRKSSYSFKNYQEAVIQEGAQDRVEQELQKRGQGPYIHTRKDAVSMTAKQMVSNDPNLRKVFVLLATCAQAPVPLSLVARVLGVKPDSRELEDVCSCALLSPPSTGLGNIKAVSVHQVTRSVLKDLFLKDTFISADNSPTLPELLHFPVKKQFKDIVLEIQNDYEKFGIQLLQDDNGSIVEGIERMKRGDPGDITVEILRQWLHEKGRKPVTWQTLVECLEATKLHVAADYIKATFGGSNVNTAPSITGEQSASISEQKNGIVHITNYVCQEFDTMSNNLASSSDSVIPFQMMRLLIPHIESLLQFHSDFHPDASREVKLCFALGRSYRHMGKYMEAREVLEKALMVYNKEGIKETREGAGVATELGWIYIQLGMLKESEHMLKEALQTYTKLYGEESVVVAEVLNHLGVTYYRSSQLQKSRECYEESLEIHEESLEIHEKFYGHKHPSVAEVLGNLGNLWKIKGDKAKAISCYEKVLAIQEEILGPDHLKVATTVHNLGLLLGGEHGIDLIKRALEINKSVLGEDHPEVARTLVVLSCRYLYHDLGDIQEAKKMAQDALFMLQNIHNLPLMAPAQHCLGMIHLELEEFEEAQKHLQSSFATRKAVYGVQHKDTRQAHLWFAMAARLAGNLQHAKEILETLEDSLLGTLRLIELGKVYLELGYLTQSLQAHGRALDIAKELNSDKAKHQIAFRRADLAQALWGTGQVRSGLEMMQQALKEYQQSRDTVSEDDSVTKLELAYRNTEHVLMLVTLSQMLQDTGNLEEARRYLEDGLQKLSQSSFSHNLVKAKTICNLGTLFNRLASQTTTALNPVAAHLYPWYYRCKARKLLNNGLDLMRKVSNAHPNTATILAAIGRLDLDSGDLYSAKLHLEEALDIQTKCCGSIHPNIALYHQLLAGVASQTGDELSAKSHSQEGDKIYRALIKREKEMSGKAGVKLPILQKWQESIGESLMKSRP